MIGFQDAMAPFQHVASCEGISLINDITLIFDSLLPVDENQVLFIEIKSDSVFYFNTLGC